MFLSTFCYRTPPLAASQYFAKFTGKYFCESVYKVSTFKHATLHTLLKKRLRRRCFSVTLVKFKTLRSSSPYLFTFFTFCKLTGRRTLSNIYQYLLLFLEAPKNFHNKWVLDVDLKVVINKDQSINIDDICHFEEIMDKLVQERSNIGASVAALLEFSQLVCFT